MLTFCNTQVPFLSSEHQIGMTDLLPPSPAAATGQRYFPSFSSMLPAPGAPTATAQEEVVSTPDSHSSDTSLAHSRFERQRSNSQLASQVQPQSYMHSQSLSLSHPSMPRRPLDYASLINQPSAAAAELDSTLKSLSQWLDVVEIGLNSVLDNAIEEETDSSYDEKDNFSSHELVYSEPSSAL